MVSVRVQDWGDAYEKGSGVRRAVTAVLALLLVTACASRVSKQDASLAASATGGSSESTIAGDRGTGTATDSASPSESGTSGSLVSGAPASGQQAVPAASKAPVVIGEVGTFSGIVGAALQPARDAFGAWVQAVNLRGGVDGHPVKLLVGDDGGDSTKSMTIVRDFVERQGAVALVDYVGSATATISSYAEQKHIPVIGGLPDESWFKSWAMFPTQPPQTNYGYAEAKISADSGVKKVAALYCSESTLCHDTEQSFVQNARAVGLDVVYEGAISLAQPDFTAECLQAKGKGAELILPVADGNSVTRVAQSCARQSYQPIYLNLSPTTEQAAEPELDGMIAVLRDFPWFLTSGSPALDEYNSVLSKFGGGHTLQFQSAIGWSAAKLFERAAARLSDKPTSQDLFAGLWALHSETLGGLVAAMQFQEMKPAVPANCAFVARVAGRKWTAPNGMRMTGCRPT